MGIIFENGGHTTPRIWLEFDKNGKPISIEIIDWGLEETKIKSHTLSYQCLVEHSVRNTQHVGDIKFTDRCLDRGNHRRRHA